MYSICVSAFIKFKYLIHRLINIITKSICANKLLISISYLTIFIILMYSINPIYKLFMKIINNFFSNGFNETNGFNGFNGFNRFNRSNKKEKKSSERKYKKINSISIGCSGCGSSNSSGSSDLSSSSSSSNSSSSSSSSNSSNSSSSSKSISHKKKGKVNKKIKLSKKKINNTLKKFKLD